MNDANGMVIETLMDLKNLVCNNDGDLHRHEIGT